LFVGEAVLGVGAAYITIRYGPETRAGQKMILHQDQTAQHAVAEPAAALVGQRGTAHTILRPSGTALIGDKRLDVIAESGIIERGSAIEVVAVRGANIIVKKA
jgi:membrane-bound serine protease (ClpP class)